MSLLIKELASNNRRISNTRGELPLAYEDRDRNLPVSEQGILDLEAVLEDLPAAVTARQQLIDKQKKKLAKLDLHLPLKQADEPEAYPRMLENQRSLLAQLESWEKAQKNAQQRLSGILGLMPELKSSGSDAEVAELDQELAGLVAEQKRLQSQLKEVAVDGIKVQLRHWDSRVDRKFSSTYTNSAQDLAIAEAARMRLKHFLDDMRAVLEHHATTEQLCKLPMPSSNLLFDYTASQTSLGYLELADFVMHRLAGKDAVRNIGAHEFLMRVQWMRTSEGKYDLICPDLEGLIGGPMRPLSVRLPSMFQEIHRKCHPDKLEASALRRW